MSTRPSPDEQERVGREEAMILISWLCELHAINGNVATEVTSLGDIDRPSVGRTCWLADAKMGSLIHQATRQTSAVVGTKSRQLLAELVVERLASPGLRLLAKFRENPEAETERYVRPGDYEHEAFTSAIQRSAIEAADTLEELMPHMAEALLEQTPENYESLISRADKALGILWRVKTTPAMSAPEPDISTENHPSK